MWSTSSRMRGSGAGSMSHSAICASDSTGVCAMSSSNVGVHWYEPPPMNVILVVTQRLLSPKLRKPRVERVEHLAGECGNRLVREAPGNRVGQHGLERQRAIAEQAGVDGQLLRDHRAVGVLAEDPTQTSDVA